MFFIEQVFNKLQTDNVSTVSSLARGQLTRENQRGELTRLSVISPQASKKGTFHFHMLVKKFVYHCQKMHFTIVLQPQPCS